MRVFSFLLVILLPLFMFGQENTVTLMGKILNPEGEALVGASVHLHETGQGALTGADGNFEISGIRPGTYHLHVSYLGYASWTNTFRITENTVIAPITLHPTDLEIGGVLIEANPLKLNLLEHSQHVTVVSSEELDKNPGGNLGEQLSREPGVQVATTGTGIGKPLIRGLGGNRLVVARNGIRQEGQQWGGEHGLEADGLRVGSVEIIKGPSSLLFGSDAIAGAVYLKPMEYPASGKIHLDFTSGYMSNQNHHYHSFGASGNHKGLLWRAGASGRMFGDIRVPVDAFAYEDSLYPLANNRVKNTAGKSVSVDAGLGIQKKWGFVKLNGNWYGLEQGFFSAAFEHIEEVDLSDDGDHRNIELPAQRIKHLSLTSNSNFLIGKNWLEVDAGYQRNHRQELDEHAEEHAGHVEGDEEAAVDLLLETWLMNSRYHHHFSEKFSLIGGLSALWQQNATEGEEFLIPSYQRQNGAVYFLGLWKPLEKVTVIGGFRWDADRMVLQEYYQHQDSLPDILLSPEIDRNYGNWSASAGFSYAPQNWINIKLNGAAGYRVPAPNELASNGVHHGAFRYELGNPALEPERNYQLDAQLRIIRKHYLFQVTPFINQFDHFIYLAPSGLPSPDPEAEGLYIYDQQNALHYGFETQAEYHILEKLHIGAGFEYVHAELSDGTPVPFMPPARILGSVAYEADSVTSFLDGLHVFAETEYAFDKTNTADGEPETSGYFVLHAGIGFDFVLGKQAVELMFRANNLLNETYYRHLSRYRLVNIPEAGRNFIIQLNLPLVLGNQVR